MVGEMRDAETARTAIEASMTGHLVVSTLHTNSSAETIVRIIDIGIDPLNFADSLLGVLAQRLVRRLCDACKKPYKPTKEEYDLVTNVYGPRWLENKDRIEYNKDLRFMGKVGCEQCGQTGYKGRIAIHELMVNSEKMKALIRQKAAVSDLLTLAFADGMKTLLMDGVQKIFDGLTDLDEIFNACRYELYS
jgi:type II secretory ATPase GspE/PulE/Tfp pilus assembly ATPase PilB-like protein